MRISSVNKNYTKLIRIVKKKGRNELNENWLLEIYKNT